MNLYTDNDEYCCEWLKALVAEGLLPPGDVLCADIKEIENAPEGYTQIHWFCGIGGWPLALRLAGWPGDRPVWTGSCPCPPFSVAGKKKRCPACGGRPVPCPRRTGYFICVGCGHAWFADARHLWPEFWRLISRCRPGIVMGEQVAGADGKIWLAGVRAGLEILGYGVRAGDLPAAGVSAPHRRQRLYWMADTNERTGFAGESRAIQRAGIEGSGDRLGDTEYGAVSTWSRAPGREGGEQTSERSGSAGTGGTTDGVADPERGGCRPNGIGRSIPAISGPSPHDTVSAEKRGAGSDWAADSRSGGFWDDYILVGPDPKGRYRRVKPGVRLLAHGVPARASKLRALGNAIVPPLAVEVIRAWMETDG